MKNEMINSSMTHSKIAIVIEKLVPVEIEHSNGTDEESIKFFR